RAPRLPCDILFGRPGDTPSSLNEDLKKLEARLEAYRRLTESELNCPRNKRRLVTTPEQQATISRRVI
ncbi:hypothetical protein AVEN_30343-1, partial [Araneus ventricosus]